jgi:two-component system CheB/CheR fusion protein
MKPTRPGRRSRKPRAPKAGQRPAPPAPPVRAPAKSDPLKIAGKPTARSRPRGDSSSNGDGKGKPRTPGKDTARFPIVALGASAGGLLALEQFFQHLPDDSGMAFIVITHQAPDRVTLLPELLAKQASIPVLVASDNVKLRPNHAYVAPPGRALRIRDGRMFLGTIDADARPHLPIDHAFRSLAQNEGDHAIGIVLSGNGSDGTLGITEIKDQFGMVMAQDPKTAQYSGMPASAIATQLVDYVLSPAQMPDQLVLYSRGRRARTPSISRELDQAEISQVLRKILAVLHARTGSDFSRYKKSTIWRRIERRMHVQNIADPADYHVFLERTAYEIDALFKDLLISVTSFFRDAAAFDALQQEISGLIAERSEGEGLRAWVAGCATGEEAYSVAIVIQEAIEQSGKNLALQVFATDLDPQALDVARAGRYPDGIAADMTKERLARFFTREDGGYRVNKELRDPIVFAVQNIIRDPPFTKLDLLSCRNLLIYLESELQKRALALFSYALRPGSLLLLGPSESITGFDDRFATLEKRWKLFRRLPTTSVQVVPDFFQSVGEPIRSQPLMRDGQRSAHSALVIAAEKVLIASFVPASVIMNERGELIYVQGRTGMFFEPAAGEPSQNAFVMAREGLRAELPGVVRRAAGTNKPVVRRGLQVKTNGGFTGVALTVMRLKDPEALRGTFLVSFELESESEPSTKRAPTRSGKLFDRVSALEDELKTTRENLQGMIEELETSNEELKSTNEELQSTNEELQSANEELETSREEMQSLNEELQTVNAELEERNRALSQTNDDMQNLLNSTDVATVFLDDKLHVKRFTTSAQKVFRLINTDIGRPISDLAANLRYDGLVEDAQEVLRTLVFREREIQTKDGEWRMMRIMPYRTHENLIDGLVITFVDIDRFRRGAAAGAAPQPHK